MRPFTLKLGLKMVLETIVQLLRFNAGFKIIFRKITGSFYQMYKVMKLFSIILSMWELQSQNYLFYSIYEFSCARKKKLFSLLSRMRGNDFDFPLSEKK